MEYLIFKAIIDGEVCVDAYRIDDKPREWIKEISPLLEAWALTLAPSRNQARKIAWKMWIHPELIGFYKHKAFR